MSKNPFENLFVKIKEIYPCCTLETNKVIDVGNFKNRDRYHNENR